MPYSALQKCTELRESHINDATATADATEALLARFAEIAAPGEGSPIILAALARLGTTACDWIDGELRVELVSDGDQTTISVSTSIGGGFREKIFADTRLRVPLDEFSRAIQRAPRLIEPLQLKETTKRIVLTATQEARRTSLPPPMIEIDTTSLMVVPRTTLAFGLNPQDAPGISPVMPPIKAQRPVDPNLAAHLAPEVPKVVLRRRAKE